MADGAPTAHATRQLDRIPRARARSDFAIYLSTVDRWSLGIIKPFNDSSLRTLPTNMLETPAALATLTSFQRIHSASCNSVMTARRLSSLVAAKLANLSDGQRADKVEGVSIDTASNMLNVGRASVARAREVHANATPELQRAVEQGKMAVIHISCKLSIDTT